MSSSPAPPTRPATLFARGGGRVEARSDRGDERRRAPRDRDSPAADGTRGESARRRDRGPGVTDTLRRNRRETDHRGRTAHADRRAGTDCWPEYGPSVPTTPMSSGSGCWPAASSPTATQPAPRASRSSANRSRGRPSAASPRSDSVWPSPPSRFRERGATTTAAKLRHGKSSSPAGSRRGGPPRGVEPSHVAATLGSASDKRPSVNEGSSGGAR